MGNSHQAKKNCSSGPKSLKMHRRKPNDKCPLSVESKMHRSKPNDKCTLSVKWHECLLQSAHHDNFI
eukprot:2590095-Amphidinium_carterae.1